jgi:hypothetical protein
MAGFDPNAWSTLEVLGPVRAREQFSRTEQGMCRTR